MSHRENLYRTDSKRIEYFLIRVRGSIVVKLQEWDRDANGFESFMMFGSWSPTVARVPCARATQKALDSAFTLHRPEAMRMVDELVSYLEPQAKEGAA